MDIFGELRRSLELQSSLQLEVVHLFINLFLQGTTLWSVCTEISPASPTTVWPTYVREVTITAVTSPHSVAHEHRQHQYLPVWREIFPSPPMTDWQLNGH